MDASDDGFIDAHNQMSTARGAVGERYGRGWRDLFAGTAVAMLAIPVANLLTAPRSHLASTLARGDWSPAAVDLAATGFAVAFAFLARKAHRRLARAGARGPGPPGGRPTWWRWALS